MIHPRVLKSHRTSCAQVQCIGRQTDRQTDRQTETNKPKAILADQHFQKNVHRFNKHARFTIIYRLTNTNLDKEILRERLIQRENCGYKN